MTTKEDWHFMGLVAEMRQAQKAHDKLMNPFKEADMERHKALQRMCALQHDVDDYLKKHKIDTPQPKQEDDEFLY